MKILRWVASATFAVSVAIAPLAVQAEDGLSASKKALIDQLLEQSGQSAKAVGMQFATAFTQQMSAILRQANPDIDSRAFVIVEEEVNKVIEEEMLQDSRFAEMIYPIYNTHFSESELTELIAFNNSPLGKKLIEVTPMLVQEGMAAGQKFGQQLGPKIQRRVIQRFEEAGISM